MTEAQRPPIISHATDPGYPPVAPPPPAQIALDKLPEPVREMLAERYTSFVAWLKHPDTLQAMAFAKIEAMAALARAGNLNASREARDLDAAAASIFDQIARGVMFQHAYEQRIGIVLAMAQAERDAERTAQDVLPRKPEVPGQPEPRIGKQWI